MASTERHRREPSAGKTEIHKFPSAQQREGNSTDSCAQQNSSEGFCQDPHASRTGAKLLKRAIGREVRRYRKMLGATITELAIEAHMSPSMVCLIENGTASASLASLQALSKALHVPTTALFRSFDEVRSATFVEAGRGLHIERRGDHTSHEYHLLGQVRGGQLVVEPYLVTLIDASEVFPISQYPSVEFLYMLEGKVVYRHGNQAYALQPGDSLFFDGTAPHGPEEIVYFPARFILVLTYLRENT